MSESVTARQDDTDRCERHKSGATFVFDMQYQCDPVLQKINKKKFVKDERYSYFLNITLNNMAKFKDSELFITTPTRTSGDVGTL